jgi:ABC-type glutathione transport system ATPase component
MNVHARAITCDPHLVFNENHCSGKCGYQAESGPTLEPMCVLSRWSLKKDHSVADAERRAGTHAGGMVLSRHRGSSQTTEVERDLVVADRLTRVVGSRQSGLRIVDKVSFTVQRFSLFAINGSSGSGKSTLLSLLTWIDRPSSGAIVFDGAPLTARSENALARWRGRHVRIIFQFFHWIPC